MKILQLIDSLNIGGAERMAVNMANAFCDDSIDNVLVCTRVKGDLNHFLPNKTAFYELNKNSTFDIFAFFSLYKLVKKENPTIIHAHSSSIYWSYLIKLLFPKKILIWHDHNGNRKNERNQILKKILHKVNGIVVVNKNLFDWAKKEIPNKHVSLINNFPYLNLEKSIDKNGHIILHLANLRHPKDHLTLIESIKILKTKTNVQFQVLCAGYDSFDKYSKLVKAKIIEYNLETEIKIIGSVIDTTSLLEQASIGVLSSVSEGLPVSLLEYGLAALPVVVTDVGQCVEVVGRGDFGLVVPPSNPAQLAEAIEWHLNNREQSIYMGISFQNHIEQEYGAVKFLHEYVSFVKVFNGSL
jgi:glycosyltransferase involved in cell wall biosynthesis